MPFVTVPGIALDITFMVPSEVTREVTDAMQTETLRNAFAARHLLETDLTSIDELEHYATLTRTLGKGESACLALANFRDWSLASDEKRLFRRTAIAEIGERNIWTTPDIIVHAIQAGLASVEEADHWKERLTQNRFT